MKERAFSFGPDGVLVGVLTEPDGEPNPALPVLLVANVGMNPRIGPFRAWVRLARHLAKVGFRTLRFDVSGLGDSLQRADSRSDIERAVADFEDAMEFLKKKRGAETFVVVGLCSGVDPIHLLAAKDRRVVGAVFIDGYTYPTRNFKVRRALRHTRPIYWRRFLNRARQADLKGVGERDEIFVREYPAAAQTRADYDAMLARGAKLMSIFSGEFDLWFTHKDQFFEMLGSDFGGQIEVEHQPETDHLFSSVVHQRWLLDRLTRFMRSHFRG